MTFIAHGHSLNRGPDGELTFVEEPPIRALDKEDRMSIVNGLLNHWL